MVAVDFAQIATAVLATHVVERECVAPFSTCLNLCSEAGSDTTRAKAHRPAAIWICMRSDINRESWKELRKKIELPKD